MRAHQIRTALVVILLTVNAGAALAWGAQGHRITALLAERLLTPETSAGIKALMGRTDLRADALYMDVNKVTLEKRITGLPEWHYDDRPVCDAQAPSATTARMATVLH